MITFLRKFTAKILNSETHTITLAAIILAASALIADILALFRDRLLAAQFGAGRDLDIYNASFRIPDFIFIVLFGSISIAFLPVFSEFRAKNEKEAWHLTNNLLTLGILFILGLSALLFFIMPFLMPLLTPGFSSGDQSLSTSLSRFLLISPVFFGISSFFSGILHYFKKFLLFSLAPLIYNISTIFGIIFLAPKFGILGVVWGVVIGAALHMLIQFPGVYSAGFRLSIKFLPLHEGVKETFLLLVPRVPSSIVANLNVMAMTAIATMQGVGALAIFTFADNLRTVPVGIIGASFATAVFPNLSQAWAQKDTINFSRIFSVVVREVSFLILPFSALFIVLRAQIVRVVLGSGRFDWEDTQLTAAVLGLFAVAIFAQTMIPVFLRAFYALKNTLLPFIVNLFCVSINIASALFLSFVLKDEQSFLFQALSKILKLEGFTQLSVLALPLAFSLSTFIQIILLWLIFRLHYGSLLKKDDIFDILKMLIAAFVCGITAFGALRPLAYIFNLEHFYGIFLQGLFAGLFGMISYIFIAWIFKIPELNIFIASFKKQFMPKAMPFSQENSISSGHIK